MKNKTTAALVSQLNAEADRYHRLAKEHALNALINDGNADDTQTARNHLIRAQTFRTAARLAAGRSRNLQVAHPSAG